MKQAVALAAIIAICGEFIWIQRLSSAEEQASEMKYGYSYGKGLKEERERKEKGKK